MNAPHNPQSPARVACPSLREAAHLLGAAGIESPEREARLLLAHAFALEGKTAPTYATPPPAAFGSLLARRLAREPFAFILGSREFWGLRFAVSRVTLIPRPESETLVEAALAAFPNRGRPLRVLDLGTGTGCLLLAVLSEFPRAFGIGSDRAPAAVALARANARALGLDSRTAFLAADWAAPLGHRPTGSFDLVLANPPYIAHAEIPGLMPEVARYEPYAALDGGADGLDAYRHIFRTLPRLLTPRSGLGGIAVVEVGAGAADRVAALAGEAGLTVITIRADLGQVSRALVIGPATKKPFGSRPTCD